MKPNRKVMIGAILSDPLPLEHPCGTCQAVGVRKVRFDLHTRRVTVCAECSPARAQFPIEIYAKDESGIRVLAYLDFVAFLNWDLYHPVLHCFAKSREPWVEVGEAEWRDVLSEANFQVTG